MSRKKKKKKQRCRCGDDKEVHNNTEHEFSYCKNVYCQCKNYEESK